MPELHVYDFDGTLFRSSDTPPWWPNSWIVSPVSLGRPCVPDKPGPDWWDMGIVGAAKMSCSDPNVYAVMLTGRSDSAADFRWRIPELLHQVGLRFDEVRLSTGGPTEVFKAKVILGILRKHPDIKVVRMWDDDTSNIAAVSRLCAHLGLEFFPTRGSGKRHRPECEKADVLTLMDEGWIDPSLQKFMRASVASRWVGRVSRQPTPESKAWDRDLKARAKHIKDAIAAFKDLLKALQPYADRAQAEFPGKDQESLQRRGRVFVKFVKDLPELNAYLDKWVGANSHDPKAYSWRSQVLYQARNVLTLGAPLKDALVEIGKQADKGFEALALAESQKPLREVLPEELRAYLPQKVVVEVDPAGVIKKVTDRFETEYETLGVKVQTMHALVHQYNAIAQQVKRDLKSGDELTRMAALVTAIIMETGIRPGKKGNGFVKIQEGNEVDVETFGAITLGPTHVKFVRDNFVRLEFVGKKGSTNVAHLTDAEVVRLLGTYVEQAKKGGSKFVFVTSKGVPFTYTDLQRYFREHFAGFSPTDFRKLKATDTVLTNLREEQQTLYARIKEFAQTSKKDLKERVVQEVVAAVQRAYERAQEALSHEDVATTIRAYVNPEILLRFISQGKVEESLSSAILTGKTTLSFDPDVFVAHALKTSGQRTGTVLMDLLVDLEADMQAEGISA